MAPNWIALVYKLSDLLQGSLASIEILPGGLNDWETAELPPDSPKPSSDFPFVLVEGNLGIPKKVLYALYTAAVSLPWRTSGAKEASAVCSVIIILNPAHQTALNTRKRLIQNGVLDPGQELILTELIARGSPECAKQSMVWDHRRWCIQKIYGSIGPAIARPYRQCWATSEEAQMLPKMSPNAIRHELDIINRTCEIYPRNYHSWAHFHFLMEVCYASIYLSDDDDNCREFSGIMTGESTRLGRWIEKHVSDYSAVHQLCQLQIAIDHLRTTNAVNEDPSGVSDPSTLVDHALSLVLAYPSHESLWMYLRVALGNSTEEKRAKVIKDVRSDRFPASHLRQHLLDWFARENAAQEALKEKEYLSKVKVDVE